MARVLGLDFGQKRCGLAVTDPHQIIVSGLDSVETNELFHYFDKYFSQEKVEKMVIGLPKHKDGSETYLKKEIDDFVVKFSLKWPDIVIDFEDEQFTSVMAKQMILERNIKKTKRQDKALLDKVSAVIILQKYLKHI